MTTLRGDGLPAPGGPCSLVAGELHLPIATFLAACRWSGATPFPLESQCEIYVWAITDPIREVWPHFGRGSRLWPTRCLSGTVCGTCQAADAGSRRLKARRSCQ